MKSLIFDLFSLGFVLNTYADVSWCNSDYSGFQTTIDPIEIPEAKEANFLNEYQKHSWLSWNFAEEAL